MNVKFNLEKDTINFNSECKINDILEQFPKEIIFEYINDYVDRSEIIDYFNICVDDFEREEEDKEYLLSRVLNYFDTPYILKKMNGEKNDYLDFVKKNCGLNEIFEYCLKNDFSLIDDKVKKNLILSFFNQNYQYDIDGLVNEIKHLFTKIV